MSKDDLAVFLTHLLNAGMSIEQAVNHAYVLALEMSRFDGISIATRKEQMLRAAERIEQAAKEAGVHLDQQRTNRMERKA